MILDILPRSKPNFLFESFSIRNRQLQIIIAPSLFVVSSHSLADGVMKKQSKNSLIQCGVIHHLIKFCLCHS